MISCMKKIYALFLFFFLPLCMFADTVVKGITYSYYYGGRAYVESADKDITTAEILTHVTIDGSTCEVVKIKFGAFYNCTKLEKVIIPNSITEIGNHSFSNCTSLKNITIPNSVKTIEKEAFFGCNYLVDFQIPKSVTEIEDYALGACERLTSITIPRGVTKIGSLAFRDWFVMKTLYCEAETPPVCADDTFQGANVSNCKLYVPEKSVEAYKKANIWKDFSVIGKIALGIDSINNETATEERVDVYTIDGLRVLQRATQSEVGELPKGIYIIKGKKVIIK